MEMAIFSETSVYAELTISRDDFDPYALTQILNIQPTAIYKKGEPAKYGSNRILTFNSWVLKTPEEESSDIDIQMDKLIQLIGKQISMLQTLKHESPQYELRVCIVIYSKNNLLPGMLLSTRHINFLNKIGADIDFDIYF